MLSVVPILIALLAQTPSEDLLQSALHSLNSGSFPEARRDFEQLSREVPDDPQVWLALTQIYARGGNDKLRSAAATRAVTVAQSRPEWQSQPAIHNYLGKVYLADVNYPQAVSEYREAIRLAPYDESYRFDLAQAQLGRQDFPQAVETLEAARKVFDKSAQLELALGVAYYGQRRFQEAVDAFLRTIALAPEVAQPYVFLGKMIDQAGARLPEVQQRFAEFLQANPDNYMAHLLVAKGIGQASGDKAREELLLRKSIALKPDGWESHCELGVLLEANRDYEQAARELEESAKLNADVAATHYHLARVYDRLQRPEAAAEQRVLHAKLTK